MIYQASDERSGFIAITSAVIIGIILLSITLTMSSSGYFSRFDVLKVQYKERSLALAEGCANTALLKLVSDRSYVGVETITLGNMTCTILPVTQNGGQFTIKTSASFPPNQAEIAVTNLTVVARSGDLGIVSWRETPN